MKKEQLSEHWWYRLLKVIWSIVVISYPIGFGYYAITSYTPLHKLADISIFEYALPKVGIFIAGILVLEIIRRSFFYIACKQSFVYSYEKAILNKLLSFFKSILGIAISIFTILFAIGSFYFAPTEASEQLSHWLIAVGIYIYGVLFVLFLNYIFQDGEESDKEESESQDATENTDKEQMKQSTKDARDVSQDTSQFGFSDWAGLIGTFGLSAMLVAALSSLLFGLAAEMLMGIFTKNTLYRLGAAVFFVFAIKFLYGRFRSLMEKYKHLRSEKRYKVLWWILAAIVALPVLASVLSVMIASVPMIIPFI